MANFQPLSPLPPTVLLRKLGSTRALSKTWNEITGFYSTKLVLTTGLDVMLDEWYLGSISMSSAPPEAAGLQLVDTTCLFRDEVYNLVKGLTVDRGERGANLTYNIYTQVWGDNPDQEVMKKTVVDLMTDYIFLIPTQWALSLHARNAR